MSDKSPLPEVGAQRTLPEESDEALMQRYRQGESRAFDALFQRHAARVHGFLLRHVRDRARADDLLQMTWLNVHRARETFNENERFTAWLYTIANNVRRDEGRKQGRDQSDLTNDGLLPEPPRGAGADDERVAQVQAALASIQENYREVIILHRWHDLSFGEIAEVLGTTEGAVKLRAHRGYLALREALASAGVKEAKAK
jgi:RNA polymerase sigma-70 factor (ECF subfamily)